MSALTTTDRLGREIHDLVRPGAVILVLTDDGADRRYVPVRDAAALLAVRGGASIVLYHAPSRAASGELGRPRCFDPLAPSSDGRGQDPGRLHTGSRRHDLLLEEAREMAGLGVPTRVWLSRLGGPAGIAEAVRGTCASLVLAPTEPIRTGALCTAVRLTLSYYAARLEVPLVAVGPDGSIAHVRALGMNGARRGKNGVPLAFDAAAGANHPAAFDASVGSVASTSLGTVR